MNQTRVTQSGQWWTQWATRMTAANLNLVICVSIIVIIVILFTLVNYCCELYFLDVSW